MTASRPWIAGLLLIAAPAAAAPPELALPAGRLADAVIALGRATGTSIGVDDPAIWERHVPPISGRLSAREALRRLADAAGADVRRAGPHGWRLVARPALPRPTAAVIPTLHTPSSLADIVVTGSKRDVRLRDLAGQATILEQSELALGGAGGTETILSRLASVSSTHLGAGRNKLFIRGIADSSFTGPTQSTVGQYLGDLRLTYNAPDPDLRLYDVGSVEVLEGPQGTLYGAGSLGGIIRIVPNAPQPGVTGGSLSAGGSLTRHGEAGGDLAAMLNLPVGGDDVGLRLVGYGASEGGYIDNPTRGEKDVNRTRIWGGRASARVDAGDGWTIDLGAVGQRTRGEDSQYADADGPPLTRASGIAEGFATSYILGQLVVSKDWDDLRFRSSAGIIGQHLRERYDASVPAGTLVPGRSLLTSADLRSAGESRLFVQRNRTRLLASETRLWRPTVDGVGWVLGTSLTSSRVRLARAIGLEGAPMPATGVTNRVDEITLYGEASVAPLPELTISAGGRATRSRLSGAGEEVTPLVEAARAGVVAARHATSLLPSAAIVAEVLPGARLFARYQQGFRPGGLAIESDYVRRFRSDRIRTLESGLRLSPPGSGIDLSFSLSHTRWSDIQADFIDSTGLPSTANIGDGRIWTVTAAGGWRPLRGLHLDLGFTMNDSRVSNPSSFAFAGVSGPVSSFSPLPVSAAFLADRMGRVPNVARYAGRLGVDYALPLRDDVALRLNGWARYVGRSRLGIGPVLGEAQGDYVDTALTVRAGNPAWGITLSATNLADAIGNRFALGTPFPIASRQITPIRPRTLRLGLDLSF